jgi:hypothetical protein
VVVLVFVVALASLICDVVAAVDDGACPNDHLGIWTACEHSIHSYRYPRSAIVDVEILLII